MSNENAVMVVNQCPIQDTENNRKMALSLNAEAMETFKKFLRLEEVSDKTVIQYHSQIKDFLSWCYENHIDVVTATYQDILEYRNYLTSKDYAKTTKQSKMVTVRRFFKALQNAHMRTDNPADSVKPSKKSSVTDKEKAARIKYLSEQEIKAMLAIAAKSNDHTKVRNQAAIVLMGLCGLRGKEVVALQRKDIDIVAKTMVINGKGDMVRKIGIPDFQFKYVLNLLATIPQSPEAFLFVNTSNKKGTSPNLSTRGLRLLIDTLMTKANIKKAGSSSHSLRHGCAMALYRHGVPIEKISVQLGHESIKTTMIYVNVADTIEKPVSSVLDCLLV